MMKVSDPIIFGHVVQAFFPDALRAVRRRSSPPPALARTTASAPSSTGLEKLPGRRGDQGRHRAGPGRRPARWRWSTPTRASPTCTCPRDVIVDASMPAMIRTLRPHVGPGRPGGRHPRRPPGQHLRRHLPGRRSTTAAPTAPSTRPPWARSQRRPDGPGGRGVRQPRQDLRDPAAGTVRVVDDAGNVLIEHEVEPGDIWRACQTKDVADPRLGQARRHPRPRHRRARRLLAGRGAAPTTPS